jgi:hypothetical protein
LIQEINWVEGLFDVPLGIKVSADRSKLLVYNFFPGTKENFGRNWLLTFDAQMKCLWSTTDKINQVDQDLLFLDYEITNMGEVMVLVSEAKKGLQSTAIDPKLIVLKYPGKGQSMEKYDLKLGVVDLQQSDLQLDNAGHLICGGLLSNRYNETNGAFVSVVDEQTKEVRTNVHYFSDAELKSLDGEPKRLVDYKLRTIHVAANGSITLLSEQFLPPFRGNNQQYYGQVLLVRYAADFSSCHLSSLNKSQVSFDRGYFDSFAYVAKGEQYLLLYNDKSKTPMRKAYFTSKGAEDTPLEYPGTEKIKVCPRNCVALSNQELWIYAETVDKKHYQVGLLGF